MADIVYKVILQDNGVKAFTMPGGFWEDVEIHCWGAGGGKGRGGAFGGGGGYAKAIVNIYEGDEVSLQIGQPGTDGGYPSGGRGGLDPSYRLFRGGNSADAQDEDADTGAGGGGGGASWVAVNDTYVCVGAGGGGAGGYGDDSSGGFAGLPGGVTTNGLNTNTRGGDAPLGWSTGGGGGAGYPFGGKAGLSYGDDAGNPPSGSGGQNYGNVTLAGSGTLPGGTMVSYYPGSRRGEANYPGYIAIILRKKLNISIKDAKGDGTWANVAAAYVKTPSTSVTVPQAVGPQTTTYNSVGTNTFTVPAGVTSIQLTVIGGGGGGGGADSSPGSAGRAGARVSGTLAVTPGQILTIAVGSGGGGGTSDQGSAPGGVGGTNSLGYSGGRGSNAGPTPISGGGGGGGAASAVLVNGSPTVVAAGGGGGGGGGNGVPGQGVSPGGTSGGIAGSAGQTKSGDGGGAGGGGGGYPQGGAGGNVGGGDVGGFSGADGQSLVPAGFSLGQGGAGGIPAIRGSRSSTGGGGGSVTVSYTPAPINVTVVTGGWKQIQAAWTKVNDAWKPILTDKDISLYDYPVKRKKANITVSVDTSDYNLYNNIPVDYFEGLMDIDVWVFANVVITGNTTSTAFTISNFNSGDNIILHNHGYIAGKGGLGGSGGYTYSDGKRSYRSPPTSGGAGGTGLLIEYPITLLNDGNIAGGGGGGGGGGTVTVNSGKTSSTYLGGKGGGGAGFGIGYNNGTLTSGGAGEATSGGTGGTGGSRGQSGSNGGGSGPGAGGAAGYAIQGTSILIPGSNVGAYFGPLAT